MDDYRQKAHQKYLEQKKIKFQEDKQLKKEQVDKIKEQEEQLRKEQEEKLKKDIYIQEQTLIIDESIKSYEIEKTDDNIMMILTIINGCIENITNIWTPYDIQNITNLVIGFSNLVDTNNINRPKGLDTIANVKILKESFEQIFKILKLDVDIQTLDTDKDEEIARKLQEEIPPENIIHQDNVDEHKDFEPEPLDGHDLEDEEYARRLQEEINKPKKVEKKIKEKAKLSTKYKGLNSYDFINTLLKEKL